MSYLKERALEAAQMSWTAGPTSEKSVAEGSENLSTCHWVHWIKKASTASFPLFPNESQTSALNHTLES